MHTVYVDGKTPSGDLDLALVEISEHNAMYRSWKR